MPRIRSLYGHFQMPFGLAYGKMARLGRVVETQDGAAVDGEDWLCPDFDTTAGIACYGQRVSAENSSILTELEAAGARNPSYLISRRAKWRQPGKRKAAN